VAIFGKPIFERPRFSIGAAPEFFSVNFRRSDSSALHLLRLDSAVQIVDVALQSKPGKPPPNHVHLVPVVTEKKIMTWAKERSPGSRHPLAPVARFSLAVFSALPSFLKALDLKEDKEKRQPSPAAAAQATYMLQRSDWPVLICVTAQGNVLLVPISHQSEKWL